MRRWPERADRDALPAFADLHRHGTSGSVTRLTTGSSHLGDAPSGDYSRKLRTFEDFAAPELESIAADLDIHAQSSVLDLGCGAGWFTKHVAAHAAFVVGLDLTLAHAETTAFRAPTANVLAADGAALPFTAASFDLVWACNAINHFRDPVAALRGVGRILRRRGRLVLAQSSLLPEMFFAWDYHLDARVRAACHAFYRDKLGLSEADTAGSTRVLGLVRDAGLELVTVRTHVIERFAPLRAEDRPYFIRYFRDYWGTKLHPFLSPSDQETLLRLCDPESQAFCADRPDFHHVQTLTVVEAGRT